MTISLSKGQKVDLTKGNPGLTKVAIGLGWDTNQFDGGAEFDLDASAFMLDTSGKCATDKDFIFYGNPVDAANSVVTSGDNLTGAGDGDDEVIGVNLVAVPATVERIAFTITIHEAAARNQNFGMVSNSYVRVMSDSGTELIRYDLGEDYSIETALVVCELYRHNGEWKFAAVGAGYQGGLAALATSFGLSVG